MFFKKKRNRTIGLPSRSHDLNQCEKIFACLSQKLYSGGKTYKNIDGLWDNLSKDFRETDLKYSRKLYDSMYNRICDVLIEVGKLTKY